jgi:hypothetical protein
MLLKSGLKPLEKSGIFNFEREKASSIQRYVSYLVFFLYSSIFCCKISAEMIRCRINVNEIRLLLIF